MRSRYCFLLFASFAFGLVAPSQVDAQEYIPDDLELTEEAAQGWDYQLRIGAGLSLATSSHVIGNADGNSWTVSLNLAGAATLVRGPHEWRNSLSITESFARTSVLDEWVKSSDLLELESIYLFHVAGAPWFGPYARLRLTSPMFAGQDVRAEDATYTIAQRDGTVDTVTASRLDLTDPFQPLTLRESVGLYARPVSEDAFNLEALLGFGARHTFAADQLAVSDDDATAEIEVIELESFTQAGAELTLSLWGELEEGRVAYNAGADFLVPFINDLPAQDDRSAFELTNIDLHAGLSFRLVEWASLEYEFRAVKEPQLLDELQIQNNLLFTLAFTLLEGQSEPEPAE